MTNLKERKANRKAKKAGKDDMRRVLLQFASAAMRASFMGHVAALQVRVADCVFSSFAHLPSGRYHDDSGQPA